MTNGDGARPPGPGTRNRGSRVGTLTPGAGPAAGARETFEGVILAPFGRWHDGGPESTKTDGSAPFTTELFALTLMALPD